ncbi:MAG: halocyanin domain-containing protein [Natronomonas sp.]
MTKLNRRTFLQGTSALAVAGALAGCSGDDSDDNSDDDSEPEGEPAPERVDTYLSDNDANLYDGTIADETGNSDVTIMNGDGPEGLSVNPPAVRIDVGTTVTWEWTGRGGAHNVVSRDQSDFDYESDGGDLVDDEGHTWSFTFDEAGTALYHCEAHTAQGQHGAIVVE